MTTPTLKTPVQGRGWRAFGAELAATAAGLAVYLGALLLVAVTAFGLFKEAGTIMAGGREDPAWIEIARPQPAFALALAADDAAQPTYALRRHPQGGRKDVLLWNHDRSDGAELRIEIYRPGTEQERFQEPAATLAERAAERGAVTGMNPAGTLASQVGLAALFDFKLRAPAGPRRCLGFVRAEAEPRLEIIGWDCRASPELIEHGLLSCRLDDLTLLSAGGDGALARLFARASLKRSYCGHGGTLAAVKRYDFIDQPQAPRLRGRLSQR
jgi:hypothetical protein